VIKNSSQFAVDIYDYLKVTFLDKLLVRFIIVGGVSFIVNGGLLFALHGLFKANLLLAQIIASEAAIAVGFSLHHHWTYRSYNQKPLYLRFLSFNLTALGGTTISTVTLLFFVHVLKIHYMISFVFGAAFAFSWSYFANKYLIWSQPATKDQ
jgi:putative flippase GtrA